MNLRGWHANGQTWLVWEDTDPTPETYSIYKSSSEISDISLAEQTGRIFEKEWKGFRLKQISNSPNRTIPDGEGGTYTLKDNEALFVYTPHDALPEYFAVVKEGETAIASNNRIGPISQTTNPVQCHLQMAGSYSGFDFKIYAHWIDGRDDWNAGRSDYPVMGNRHINGVGYLFRIWDPKIKTIGEYPAIVKLHGGGGWYGLTRPFAESNFGLPSVNAYAFSPCDNVLIKKSGGNGYQNTYWLGYWEGYNRFQLPDTQPVPNDGIVVNYTMRRVDWELGWLLENEEIDPTRISLMGSSMGGRGANYIARFHPERYASWLTFSPGIEPVPDDPLVGLASQNLSTNLPGSPGVLDIMDLHSVLSVNERDIPFGKVAIGRADQGVASAWNADLIQMVKNMNNKGIGYHLFWDERGHGFTNGSHWHGSLKLKANQMITHRSDQSFPAFFNDDQDLNSNGRQPVIGNGEPSNGDTWGTWGGYLAWDTENIIDSPTRWESSVFLTSNSEYSNDVPDFDSCRTNIAIRRPQQFKPSTGSSVSWSLTRLSDSKTLQSGEEVVETNGIVIIPDLIIHKEICQLAVSGESTSISEPEKNSNKPFDFVLGHYPNTIRSTVTITYHLSLSGSVYVALYDLSGNLVKILVNEKKNQGDHSVSWEVTGLNSGIYFYKMETRNSVNVKKCLIIR